jgi:recombinational DNA repair protein (RecF pathway)
MCCFACHASLTHVACHPHATRLYCSRTLSPPIPRVSRALFYTYHMFYPHDVHACCLRVVLRASHDMRALIKLFISHELLAIP